MEYDNPFKYTRKLHRETLKSAKNNDVQSIRENLNTLYDAEHSPLTQVTSGPNKLASVPLVDAILLSARERNQEVYNEVAENLNKVGETFGYSRNDVASIVKASQHASMLDNATPRERSKHIKAMNARLSDAGVNDIGLSIPGALETVYS